LILKVIVKGVISGKILKTTQPINFLGAVDKKTGQIHDSNHDLYKKSIKDSILVFPHGIGSSVGAYTIYSLKNSGTAPKAMICLKSDLTVASGCALTNIPLITVNQQEFDSLETDSTISLNTETSSIMHL
jgi:predicted aconitase with swiveling domain